MKKQVLLYVSVILAFIVTGCASNNTTKTAPDSYDSEMEMINGGYEKEEKKYQTERVPEKRKKTTEEKLNDLVTFTNTQKFKRYDLTQLFTPELSGLKEKNAQVLIRLEDRYAGWGSTYAAAYYIVLFNAESRQKLAKAADAYFSDFDNKRLQRKGKHTDRIYGRLPYSLAWGTTASITPNYGSGEGYMGYEFIKNSPYFVVYNYSFENKYYERAGESTTRESMTLRYYFTRSQIKQLLELISEENIASQLSDSTLYTTPTEADEYTE